MVEIDIARTIDGELILMHDKTIDRTTSGKGKVADYTLAQLKEMRLRNGMNRVASQFTIPTLEEAMIVAKGGNIKINLDKADKYFGEVYTILERTGTLSLAVIKSSKPYETLKEEVGENLTKMEFMPVVHISNKTKFEDVRELFESRYSMYEIVFEEENTELMLAIKAELEGSDSRIWINSLWSSLCAGYSDDKALKDSDGTWGYLIETLGARALQTDRPAMLIEYLKGKNLHR